MTSARETSSLWPELLGLLQSRGELPLQHEVMTPGEIAHAVERSSGDGRTQRFVWEYYYPHFYGGEPGALSEDEARALIDSFRPRPWRPPAPPPPGPLPAVPESERCGVCHSRPVRHQE